MAFVNMNSSCAEKKIIDVLQSPFLIQQNKIQKYHLKAAQTHFRFLFCKKIDIHVTMSLKINP